jgi:glycine/D-amino acid oxidase-like deaminating enzyme
MADYDVAVIGAGVHGASAAYHLADRGLHTVILERGHPADGSTTGRSSAICRAFYTNGFLARVAHESIAVLADFETQVGGPAGFHRTGALFLHGTAEVADVAATVNALCAAGIGVRALSPDDLLHSHPEIDVGGVAIAVWEADAGYADPVLTTTCYISAARLRGAVVRIKTLVRAVEPGHPVRLELTDGTLTADRVLVAAGPWTRDLMSGCGVDIPTHAERHVVAGVECRPAPLPYAVADTVRGWYGKPDVGGRYLAGGLTAEPAVDADTASQAITEDEQLRYIGLLVGRFPALADSAPARGWAGIYDVSPDWQPIIGEAATGVVVDCGSSGHGFKLAPVLGRYVAALVAGEDVPELREFHPDRFARGEGLAAGFGDARILG